MRFQRQCRQAAHAWSRIKIVKGQYDANFFSPCKIDNRLERARGAELDVDERGTVEKSREQIAALFDRQFVRAAFTRMARDDDERRGQARNLHVDLAKMIETQFEKIRRLRQTRGETQFVRGGNDPDELRSFDPLARSHILSAPMA